MREIGRADISVRDRPTGVCVEVANGDGGRQSGEKIERRFGDTGGVGEKKLRGESD